MSIKKRVERIKGNRRCGAVRGVSGEWCGASGEGRGVAGAKEAGAQK
jgi:hypothetical protein